MTKHEHTSGCINTYPDCENIEHSHGGVKHEHPVEFYADGHEHREYDVPDSPGNYPAEFECTYYANNDASHCLRPAAPGKVYCEVHVKRVAPECSIGVCSNETPRPGQPCDPCDVELGVG